MKRIIYSPDDIVRGKLYKSLYCNKVYYDTILYLGCAKEYYNDKKFLVIVMDDTENPLVGGIVSDDFFQYGFEEQD